ncbi:MAG TPA: protein-methionine-sulfoxide reductase heme-binding subunit MsrQ [Aliiroseovarius sp.]|nr:protein-methionine-sulfoxide reductase heme-binding subunit MsrQ [Aliiroseovarius sp.]
MRISQSINGALRRVPTWLLYLAGIVPPVWLFYLAVTGGLGADPVRTLELKIGKLGLQVLVASLAITPLRKFTGISLIRFRRAISLIGFSYILLHLTVWLVLDVQIPAQILIDIAKRPYITIGMAAFALMIPLAMTSNNWSMRRLGALKWRQLHKLTYLVLLLAGTHYALVGKVWRPEALLYLAGIVLLLATRINGPRVRARLGKALGRGTAGLPQPRAKRQRNAAPIR